MDAHIQGCLLFKGQVLSSQSLVMQTNNPRKIEMLEALGVRVMERIPCVVQAQSHNLGYLSTKRNRMKHYLGEDGRLDGSFCYWNHDGEPLQVTPVPDRANGVGPMGNLVADRAKRQEQADSS